ncbi:DUF3347 domain-containing protein [Pedobacter sp. BS3]|uniref:DUF3347 domain-containing protein n=1 Tax=Pedobacter sp. BS3 TaxID=2567937 RepID=UPI0011EDC9FF|nr:DUF3347 domain-containing protein [Pedobacter sp. BS3]TZF84866.1 DUF3347 domain-containing protein [Pedobacter sp. BS3]
MTKIFTGIFILMLFISLGACVRSTHTAQDAGQKDSLETVSFKNDTLAQVYTWYTALKNDLVKADSIQAEHAADTLAQILKQIDGCDTSVGITEKIGTVTDLKIQRDLFVLLNNDLMPIFRHAKLTAGSIYVQYCPMADNGNGAYWLSSSKEIRNPYYGNEMLTCGSVKEKIR